MRDGVNIRQLRWTKVTYDNMYKIICSKLDFKVTKKVMDLDRSRLVDSTSGWVDVGAGWFPSISSFTRKRIFRQPQGLSRVPWALYLWCQLFPIITRWTIFDYLYSKMFNISFNKTISKEEKNWYDFLDMLSLAGRVTVVGELWGRRRVIPGLSSSPNPNTVQCSTLWSLVCVRRSWLTTTNQGHNWFGDEWPSLGLTEEEFLIEYSKTLDKLADTHNRYKICQ